LKAEGNQYPYGDLKRTKRIGSSLWCYCTLPEPFPPFLADISLEFTKMNFIQGAPAGAPIPSLYIEPPRLLIESFSNYIIEFLIPKELIELRGRPSQFIILYRW